MVVKNDQVCERIFAGFYYLFFCIASALWLVIGTEPNANAELCRGPVRFKIIFGSKQIPNCSFVCNNVRRRSKWFSSLSHLVRVSDVTRAYRTAAASPGAGQCRAPGRDSTRTRPGPARHWRGREDVGRPWSSSEESLLLVDRRIVVTRTVGLFARVPDSVECPRLEFEL